MNRNPLAYLCLVGIPCVAFALAWHSIPAAEWNFIRSLLIFVGKFLLALVCAIGAWVAMAWAIREVTKS